MDVCMELYSTVINKFLSFITLHYLKSTKNFDLQGIKMFKRASVFNISPVPVVVPVTN